MPTPVFDVGASNTHHLRFSKTVVTKLYASAVAAAHTREAASTCSLRVRGITLCAVVLTHVAICVPPTTARVNWDGIRCTPCEFTPRPALHALALSYFCYAHLCTPTALETVTDSVRGSVSSVRPALPAGASTPGHLICVHWLCTLAFYTGCVHSQCAH